MRQAVRGGQIDHLRPSNALGPDLSSRTKCVVHRVVYMFALRESVCDAFCVRV